MAVGAGAAFPEFTVISTLTVPDRSPWSVAVTVKSTAPDVAPAVYINWAGLSGSTATLPELG